MINHLLQHLIYLHVSPGDVAGVSDILLASHVQTKQNQETHVG